MADRPDPLWASTTFPVRPIGVVRTTLLALDAAPRQGDEGAPDVVLSLRPELAAALDGLAVGDEVLVLTWFHHAVRDQLTTRPRNDPGRDRLGVFATRSPDRPNPIGLHRVTIRSIDGADLAVGPCEAIDGTPVVDLKPTLGALDDR